MINAFEGCFVEVDPSPISKKIIDVINSDIEAGNVEKIDHITLKPSNMLSLYLEGALPLHSIINADDRGSLVVLKDVPFTTLNGILNFDIYVSEGDKIATIDKNGDVV